MPNDSIYNDAAFDITSVPSWKSPPLHGAYAPNARLTPRMKVGIGAGAVVLAASGMFAWSDYSAAQAEARVRQEQIALDSSRLDLQRQQQQAAQAAAAQQETPAQKARREAVEACVTKAGGSYNAVSDCASAFPAVVDASGMTNTAQTVAGGKGGSPDSGAGLVVLGSVGAAFAVGWAKKRFAHA